MVAALSTGALEGGAHRDLSKHLKQKPLKASAQADRWDVQVGLGQLFEKKKPTKPENIVRTSLASELDLSKT